MTEDHEEAAPPGGEEAHAIDVECGANKASLHLERVQMGSKGACVLFDAAWITPNEFQFVSGRETAKDWKRSIKHGGKSLKILLARHLVSFRPPFCICEGCSPVRNHFICHCRVRSIALSAAFCFSIHLYTACIAYQLRI